MGCNCPHLLNCRTLTSLYHKKALGVNTIIFDSEQNNADLHLGDDNDIISNDSINDIRSEGSGKQEPLYNGSQWVGSEGTDTERGIGTVQEADGGVSGVGQENGVIATSVENIRNSGNNRRLTVEQEENLKESVVKNEDGTPKTVYHFTDNMEFDTFGEGDIGFHFGSMMQAEKHKDDLKRKNMLKGEGRYISAHLDIKNPVKVSSDIMVWHAAQTALKLWSDGVITLEERLQIEEMQVASGGTYNSPAAVELRRILAEQGYDGIVYPNLFEGEGESYIAFYPEQVIVIDDGKSNSQPTVDGERESGFRSPSDKDIYRDPTKQEKLEELSDERKNAKQRHITDIAKKLDSDLKIAWVDRNSPKLNGKNGKYVREINTIYLAKDMSVAEMYVEVFKHEFIHRLESRGTYKAFKDYLINKSVAFEQYVRGSLKQVGSNALKKYNQGQITPDNAEAYVEKANSQIELAENGSREEVIKALTEHYYNSFINDKTLGKPIRDKFTIEGAEREIIADFGGEVLFKGRENRADVAQHLADSLADNEMLEIGKIESNLDALEELAKTDRNLFQKLWDIIRDFIENLKGIAQNKSLVEDLEYIEQRLARVYDSHDTKKAAEQSSGVQYSMSEDIKLYRYIEDALSGNLPKKSYYKINEKISNRLAKDIEKIVGFSVEGFGNEISPGNIQHIENEHGANGRKDKSMQDHRDLACISFVIDNYEKIVEGKISGEYKNRDGSNAKTVVLQKRIDDEFYYVVEAVPDANLKTLHVVSAYKNKKDTFSDVPVSNDPRRYVQDEHQPNVSNNSIDENTPTVKNNISTDNDNYSHNGQFSVGSPMQKARESFITHSGENLKDTPDSLKPQSNREWSAFNRSFSNQTNNLQNGERKNIIIHTAEAQYIVTADGYMSGTIVVKNNIDEYNEMEAFVNDYTSSKVFSGSNDRYGNRQRDYRNDGNEFKNGDTDSFYVELDAFIEEHSEFFRNNRESYADYKRRVEDTYQQFSIGSPMQIARENLIKYENGELTREQYLEENERKVKRTYFSFKEF